MKKILMLAAAAGISFCLGGCADNHGYVPSNEPVNSIDDVDECPRADGQPCK